MTNDIEVTVRLTEEEVGRLRSGLLDNTTVGEKLCAALPPEPEPEPDCRWLLVNDMSLKEPERFLRKLPNGKWLDVIGCCEIPWADVCRFFSDIRPLDLEAAAVEGASVEVWVPPKSLDSMLRQLRSVRTQNPGYGWRKARLTLLPKGGE